MKLDLNTPEAPADLDAWKTLVAKADPIEKRLSRLTRRDSSGVVYPLVAESGSTQQTHPLGDQATFTARLGKAPTWDVRAVLSIADEVQGNASVLDALSHGATTLEFRLGELKSCSLERLFTDVTRSFVNLLIVVEREDSDSDISALKSQVESFKSCTWTSTTPSAPFAYCNKSHKVALSSLDAIDRGAHPALELASLLSSAVGYYREGGTDALSSKYGPALYITTESTIFMNIAKLRALKRLYEGIRSSLHVSHPWELFTLSSPRSWTRDAPWNNQLRATASLMSASIGGATSIGVLPATDSLESQRIALTAHSVAALESHLGQVDDPARGSYLIESLTNDLAKAAWSMFQTIEQAGGIGAKDGQEAFSKMVTSALQEREDNLARRARSYVGVSEFPSLEDDPSDTLSALKGHQRDSEAFELLRHNSHDTLIRLVTLGSPARHLARKTFAEHALAAGGFSATNVSLEEAAGTEFTGIQILCGHDDDYESSKEQIEKILGSSTTMTFLASKKALGDLLPPEQRLYLGMNLLGFLQSIAKVQKES